MKEQLEAEKAQLEERIKANQKLVEDLNNAIYWDRKRLATNKRQTEALEVKPSEKPEDGN